MSQEELCWSHSASPNPQKNRWKHTPSELPRLSCYMQRCTACVVLFRVVSGSFAAHWRNVPGWGVASAAPAKARALFFRVASPFRGFTRDA